MEPLFQHIIDLPLAQARARRNPQNSRLFWGIWDEERGYLSDIDNMQVIWREHSGRADALSECMLYYDNKFRISLCWKREGAWSKQDFRNVLWWEYRTLLRACILWEHTVGKTECGDKPTTLHQVLADGIEIGLQCLFFVVGHGFKEKMRVKQQLTTLWVAIAYDFANSQPYELRLGAQMALHMACDTLD